MWSAFRILVVVVAILNIISPPASSWPIQSTSTTVGAPKNDLYNLVNDSPSPQLVRVIRMLADDDGDDDKPDDDKDEAKADEKPDEEKKEEIDEDLKSDEEKDDDKDDDDDDDDDDKDDKKGEITFENNPIRNGRV